MISAKNGSPPAGTSEDGCEAAFPVGLTFLESKLNVGAGGGGGTCGTCGTCGACGACGACGGLTAGVGKEAGGKGGADTLGREILELFL